MAIQPELQVPETQPSIQRFEVKPVPIPPFDGQNSIDVASAFNDNLTIVSGGPVVDVDGIPFETDGVLGTAKFGIDTRLGSIEASRQGLASERGLYGAGPLRAARLVREL